MILCKMKKQSSGFELSSATFQRNGVSAYGFTTMFQSNKTEHSDQQLQLLVGELPCR